MVDPKILVTIFGLVPFLAGVYFLFVWFSLQKWPVTTGKVKGSRLEKMLGTKHGGGRGMGMTSTYKPYVRYEYEVNGRIYSSKNIKIGIILSGIYVEKYVHRYPVHAEVDVHYNPKKPKQAFLETDLGFGVWLNLVIGIAFLILAQMV
ncbi:MAG: DUF3592 domain-containing protein [Gammaproteobacteria bacterium]|nr:DUF3592 domain-containing protein [Gammaproteobacteria bacterium]